MNKLPLAFAVAGAAMLALSSHAAVSSNIVGYVKLNLTPGLNLVSNPLNNTNPNGNKITSIFAGQTLSVLRWGGTGFASTDLFAGTLVGGDDGDLLPGEAFFVDIGSAATLTLVGEALTGTQTVQVPAGNGFVASKIPLSGTATELGLAPAGSISLLTWNNATGSFQAFDYLGGVGWLGGEPTIAVGQGVLVQSGEAFTWSKTFTP